MDKLYLEDIEEIIAHRYDNGADYWTTEDRKLLKGAPFTTLESPMYLLELGVSPQDAILTETAELIFSTWREDGRFKTSPSGGLYPCHTALALRNLCVFSVMRKINGFLRPSTILFPHSKKIGVGNATSIALVEDLKRSILHR